MGVKDNVIPRSASKSNFTEMTHDLAFAQGQLHSEDGDEIIEDDKDRDLSDDYNQQVVFSERTEFTAPNESHHSGRNFSQKTEFTAPNQSQQSKRDHVVSQRTEFTVA